MNTCLVKVLPFTDCWFFYLSRLLWLLLTSQGSLLLLALADSSLRPPQLWTYSFHLILAWFTLRIPNSYGTLSCFADLSTLLSLGIKFLYVGVDVCLRLPSDSTSRWTPLLSAVAFPLLGCLGDLHPLEYVRAGRTKKSVHQWHTLSIELFKRNYQPAFWRILGFLAIASNG